MKKNTLAWVIYFSLLSSLTFAQRGKNGPLVVSSTITVNEYTSLTVDAFAGNTSVTVTNSGLNAHGRFSASLAPGDLVMIIQMQGASIKGIPDTTSAIPNDSSWGGITNYNNCGNNEIQEVASVPNSTTIVFTCALVKNYTVAGKVQVVRIPRYSSLTVNSGDTITCDAWDSVTGGIIAIENSGNTIINSGGSIDASALGFRGAALINMGFIYGETMITSSACCQVGALKGEGIAGYNAGYDMFGGGYCRGSAANAGGGGESVNAGGGGGSNAGDITKWINGDGNPDISQPGYITAWNLEETWFSTVKNSGGGRGGYTWSRADQDPLKMKPDSDGWQADYRRPVGGLGGRPLDYSTGRLFLGGGGGAGHENDTDGGAGGNGGGMIYLISYGTVSGSGMIVSDGANGGPDSLWNGDGPGGAGGGGTIVINSTGTISGISIEANGGIGGLQTIALIANEAEGPGGGGGGGYIATTNNVTESVKGGANGTTLSLPTFPADGATSGGAGTMSLIPPDSLVVSVKDTILCPGDSTHFFSSPFFNLTGGPPSFTWTFTGGSPSTSTLQNPAVGYSSSGTYVVKLVVTNCLGASDSITKTFQIQIIPLPKPVISGTTPKCPGELDTLSVSGGTTYLWSNGSTQSSYYTGPLNADSTITVIAYNSLGCPHDTFFTIHVIPTPTAAISALPNSVCKGDSAMLSASGGTTYQWSTGETSTSIWVKPNTTTTYTLHAYSIPCSDSTVINIDILPATTASNIPNDTICFGDSATLSISASGGIISYKWSTGATTSSISVSPTVNTTYTATVLGRCDTLTKTGMVIVMPLPKPVISGTIPKCPGEFDTLTVIGGTTYLWSNGSTQSSYYTGPLNADSTITVIAFSSFGCSHDTAFTIHVIPTPTAAISALPDSVCKGDSVLLSASGGTTYRWSTGETSTGIWVKPTTTTTYTLYAYSIPCSDSATIQIGIIPATTASIIPNDTICFGDTATLAISASGGSISYLWNTGATTSSIRVSPGTNTTYTATAFGRCDTIIKIITVTVEPIPMAAISGTPRKCQGTPDTLTVSGGCTYIWSNGATSSTYYTRPINADSAFSVIVKSCFGCAVKDSFKVLMLPVPNVSVTNDSICQGSCVTLIANSLSSQGSLTFYWSNGATTDTTTVCPDSNTVYSVTVSLGGCITTKADTVTLFIPEICKSCICCDTIIYAGGTAILTTQGYSGYQWMPPVGLNCDTCSTVSASPPTTTTYTVTTTDAHGCKETGLVTVAVENYCMDFKVPNVFTPNGDGINETFEIDTKNLDSWLITIYDRWGIEMFKTTNPDTWWNGLTKSGGKAPDGVYYYIIKASCQGNNYNKDGFLQLIR